MNKGQRLQQKKTRRALERAKYNTPIWERDKKGTKKTTKIWGSVTDLSRIRL